MSVSSGNDKREGRKPDLVVSLLAFFEKHGVDVTFEVIHGNQRLIESEREAFRIADAYQQSYTNAISHFVECLRTGRPFETYARDHLKTLRLVEEAYACAP